MAGRRLTRELREIPSIESLPQLPYRQKVRARRTLQRVHLVAQPRCNPVQPLFRRGTLNPNEVDPVRLFYKDGKLYSLDNRRLWAFKEAGKSMPYRMATPEEVSAEAYKFTTKNDGASVRVRGQP
jgi:hypothetical protein